jgi:D-alanyl-D-alanine endopeptidase (penicillin-binding protein 7)
MLLRALRVWGALLLVALVASPAMMAGPASATTSHRSKTRTQARASIHRAERLRAQRHHTGRRALARRHHRPPPRGGVYARNALVLDPATDRVLFEKQAEETVPIASLTKLMSALVFLEQKPDLRRQVEVTYDEIHGGGHTQLLNRERVALYDLLHMSLMNSDNVATRVLARESDLAPDSFVARMNDEARELGLANTHFAEPTGLDERDVSTATDVARLLRAAANHYLIREVTTTPSYVFVSEYAGRRRTVSRTHHIVNTNRLLRSNRYEFNCSKTGFISQSGYCVATWLRDQGRDLIAVVLGAPTNATRFADVVRLVQRTETLSLDPAR